MREQSITLAVDGFVSKSKVTQAQKSAIEREWHVEVLSLRVSPTTQLLAKGVTCRVNINTRLSKFYPD